MDRRGFLAATAGMAAGAMTNTTSVAADATGSSPAPAVGGIGSSETRSPRLVTVAAISGGLESHVAARASTVKENVDRVIGCIDKLASCKPDLIALTECFHCANVGGRVDANAVPADHEIVQRVAAKARRLNTNIVAPIYERRGDRTFNTALWIDRSGKIAGRYDKIHPTEGEIDSGSMCGTTKPTILDMDFGRVGMQICFDLNWPQGWSDLRRAGAELIVWPSAYAGGRPLAAMAYLNQVFVLTATWPRRCKLFDISGDIITECGRLADSIIGTIDLDRRLFHWDFHEDRVDKIRAQYGRDVHIDIYHEEGWFALNSLREGLSVNMLMEEFKLVPLADYLKRATGRQDASKVG